MNNLLNEYFRFNFELNIELNHFLARFNIKMNNQNISATPTRWSIEEEPGLQQHPLGLKASQLMSQIGFIS